MLLSTRQVSQITGATLRQLQWWDERGIVSPNQKGPDRRYSPDDLLRAQLLIELRRRWSLQTIQGALLRLLQRSIEIPQQSYLVTDGRQILALTSSEALLLQTLSECPRPVILLGLTEIRRRLAQKCLQVTGKPLYS